ncbi:MAG: hypothetical protein U0414_21435 [Polyangiaceae bacterium]
MVRRAMLTVVVAASVACGAPKSAARPSPIASASTSASAASSSAAVVDAPCPPIDLASLEPAMRPDTQERFTLGALFPRNQVRAAGATPMKLNLGKLGYAASGLPSVGIGHVSASPGFSRKTLPNGVRAALEPLFEAWITPFSAALEHARARSALTRRQRLLELDEQEPNAGVELYRATTCVVQAAAAADADRNTALEAERAARAPLIAALKQLTDPTADERYLLGVLLWKSQRDEGYDGAEVRAVARQQMEAIARDESAPRPLRRLAEMALANTIGRGDADATRADHLTRAAALADDPIDQRSDLSGAATLAPKGAKRRKALEALLPRYRAQTGDAARDDLAWFDYALGDARLEDGDVDGALTLFAECLVNARLTEDDSLDPYGCTTSIATVLRRVGGVTGETAKLEVPKTYAGALGFAVLSNAIEVLDRDTARTAGALVMDVEPDATDAVHVLLALADLAVDPARRDAYNARRVQDFGRTSAWFQRERRRAAALGGSPKDVEALLVRSGEPCSPEPTNEDGWRVEITDLRAPALINDCLPALLDDRSPRIVVHIDTTGPSPSAQITSDTKAADSVACIEQSITVHFRSVPPALLTLVVSP